MKSLNTRRPRIAGLLVLALGAVALLALSGVATAKDRRGDDHGHHGRHHHHHQFPMREAGTISTFDATTGKLTIGLIDGGSVTGLVTESTEIKCEGVDDRRARRDHGGNEPGDDNGGHGNEPGDDNGGQFEPGDDHGGHGNEPGDDNGGDSSGPGPSGESGAPAEGAPTPVPAEASCTVASLIPGAIVGEAELRLEGGTAAFEEVELDSHS
jgi:hypothetical protein